MKPGIDALLNRVTREAKANKNGFVDSAHQFADASGTTYPEHRIPAAKRDSLSGSCTASLRQPRNARKKAWYQRSSTTYPPRIRIRDFERF
jgi:hypothetical protein